MPTFLGPPTVDQCPPMYYDQVLKDKAKKREEEVKSMITNEKTEILTTIELIDDIQRLGLGYKYEDEIRRALSRCVSWVKNNEGRTKNLYATALSFRLLRQHGYEVSQDIFKSFMDGPEGCLTKDVKGMLALYEASYLAFEGEHLLDEAREFTCMHLNNVRKEEYSSQSLNDQVIHGLELPLHHRMPRLQARWYIEAYGKRPDANKVLLEDAKLDFNMVQSTLQSDLKDISRWWKGLNLANKLSFTRDRLMECFFWTVGMVFEPQYSDLRKGLTKVTSLITVIDDVYDVYGTLDELELFTAAVERWDIKAVQTLPDYMKICFLALYNTINDMAYDTLKEHDEYILSYLTKAWTDMCKAFLQEKKWSQNKETPPFKDYLENGWVSVSGVVILVHTYFLMSKSITKQGLESLEKCHNLLRWPSIIFRLCNDLGTSTAELERGETASSILCMMRETGVSEELARKNIRNLVEETWKKLNKDKTDEDSPFSKPFIETAINLARISECTYQNGDAHGAPDSRSKNRMDTLYLSCSRKPTILLTGTRIDV
ncbi:Isoprene synthase [Morus notabilis]|uniref:Isoprene synthase n=1 Tax=Morus notabilis TaxID=981085 RepID=W9S2U4_9ROSA|nr:Isoprene synthase [Morus notabilis]